MHLQRLLKHVHALLVMHGVGCKYDFLLPSMQILDLQCGFWRTRPRHARRT